MRSIQLKPKGKASSHAPNSFMTPVYFEPLILLLHAIIHASLLIQIFPPFLVDLKIQVIEEYRWKSSLPSSLTPCLHAFG